MIVENLTNVFNYIFKQTLEFYVERKNYLENIGRVEVVPKCITKNEIYRAFLASLYVIIMELQQNELHIYDVVVLSDDVEQTSLDLFEKTVYPQMKSALNEQRILVVDSNDLRNVCAK